MRIVHLVEDLRLGGMETLIAGIVRGLRDRGHEVSIVAMKEGGVTADQLAREGIPVSVLSVSDVTPASLFAVRRGLTEHRPDLAHLHGLPAGTFGRLALMGTRVRTVYHLHTQVSIAHELSSAMARRERLLARLPGEIIAISRSVRRDLAAAASIREERIRVLSGGVPDRPHPSRREARTSMGIDPDAFVVASTSALKENKRVADLIEAVAGTPQALLLIAGEGPEEEALRTRADDLRISDRVRFLGQMEDVVEMLSAASVFALASWPREGLSLAAIEALRAGRPAVVSDTGGLPEVVPDGVCGIVVPARDPGALRSALRRLAGDASLAAGMGEEARARFLACYDLESYLGRLERIYEGSLEPSAEP